MLVDLRVDQYQIAFPHPTGHAATYFDVVVPRVSEIEAFVHEALEVGVRAGVACMAEAMPYCRMRGHERHVAELHIPPTEIVYDGYVVPDYARDRMDRGKTRFAQCAPCRWEPVCEGPWRGYPERMGSDEFQPVAGPRVVDATLLLDDRFGMLGAPAPSFPELVAARAPWVAVAFYAEEGSPACTAELSGLRAAEGDLAAKGIAVVPVCAVDRRGLARAYGAWRQGPRRSTYVLDAARRIAHVVTDVDVRAHAAQIAQVVARLTGPPRPLGRRPDLVLIRSKDGRREPMAPEEVRHLVELEG
jgi:peroxiredoxin